MPFAQAPSRGLRSPILLGALPPLVLAAACGGGSVDERESLALPPGDYEGSNFYEPGVARDSPPPAVPSDFYEFVGGDEPAAVCARGPAPEPVDTPDDPSLRCPPITTDPLSNFTYAGGNPNGVTFGADAAVRGGTFFYPEGALTSDVSGNDWHLSGTVDAVSGFGIYLNGCRELDASAYRGISFTLSGQIGQGGGLVFFVGTAENQISSDWLHANGASDSDRNEPPNLGRCTPVGSQYDGSCREARTGLMVPGELRPVRIEWKNLEQGCPAPSVDPSEITSIAWYFPQVGQGPYSVDIRIDDLRFTNEGPL